MGDGEGGAGILFAGGGFFGGEWGNGDFNHEWARIFTNGEGRGNGRDEGEGSAGGLACGGGISGLSEPGYNGWWRGWWRGWLGCGGLGFGGLFEG